MFVITIPQSDLDALQKHGVEVRVNGEMTTLTLRGNSLFYDGQEKPIVQVGECMAPIRGQDESVLVPSVQFTCGSFVGQDIDIISPLG
jgi:hypothetical protein